MLEVVAAVAAEVGASRVGLRLSPYGTFLDMCDSVPRAVEKNIYLLQQLGEKVPGMAYVHLVSVQFPPQPALSYYLCFAQLCSIVGQSWMAHKGWSIPHPMHMAAAAREQAAHHMSRLVGSPAPVPSKSWSQIEPRLAAGIVETEGPIDHSLEPIRGAAKAPVLVAGGYKGAADAGAAVTSGDADAVVFGRCGSSDYPLPMMLLFDDSRNDAS